jgi:predicted porin
MKKSLLAVAAMGAFASAAQAQSSVTVYGLLDVGYIGYNTRQATGTPGGNVVNKTTGNIFSQSGESTSRLGFRGVEDLGGGTSAFFTIELQITPQSAQAVSTGNGQNRQAFVGLRKNGVGAASIGTQYTLIHSQMAVTDPGNQNNIAGNLMYPAFTEGGATPDSSTGAAYTVRTNNQIQLNSDSFAGFRANAIWVANDRNQNQTTTITAVPGGNQVAQSGGLNNQNGWGLGANYTWQKLYATVNYQSFTSKQNTTTIVNAPSANTLATEFPVGTPQQGYAGGASSPAGTNVKDNQWYAAATYDFGILKAYVQWIDRKVTAQQDSSYYIKRSAQQIGVRSFITPTIETWASGGLGRYTGFGANTANLTAWQIGSNYWLSKRTNLYAIYGQVGTSNTSLPTTTNRNPNPISANGSNYAVGVRHTF